MAVSDEFVDYVVEQLSRLARVGVQRPVSFSNCSG